MTSADIRSFLQLGWNVLYCLDPLKPLCLEISLDGQSIKQLRDDRDVLIPDHDQGLPFLSQAPFQTGPRHLLDV